MRRRFSLVLVLLSACAGTDSLEPGPQRPLPRPLPAIAEVKLTTDVRLVPRHPRGGDLGDPAHFDVLPAYEAAGYGELDVRPGEPHTGYTLDGTQVPVLGKNAKRLLRFAHLGDLQLGDDEAPTRVGLLDARDVLDSALRPQDPHQCRLSNAAVRTLNALHQKLPLSFVLVGGDVLDSALGNEADWALSILDGAPVVECDSGDDDELRPGPDNDPKDPFFAEGLSMPWKWVTGNHDVLVQGNFAVNDEQREVAVGNVAPYGTRDYTQGGAVVQRPIVKDARRAPLSGSELLAKVGAHGDGHGIGPAQIQRGKAFYQFDAPGTPLRFLVLDTNADSGGSDGLLRRRDLDDFVKPAIESARREGKWLILVSDHAAGELSINGGPLGTPQPDAVLADEWLTLLGQNNNILYSIIPGYTQSAKPVRPAMGHAHWEVENGALGDYPVQFRLFEIWDGDNGYVMLRATCVDLALDGDPVAAEGRRRAVIDVTSTWKPDPTTMSPMRNVELWIRKP